MKIHLERVMFLSAIKKAVKLIKNGEFSEFFQKLKVYIFGKMHSIRTLYEDLRIGNLSMKGIIKTKYAQTGAFDTQSTDYKCLDKIFDDYPLKEDEVFIDVGCGQGRVLTYLYLRKFRGSLIGVELDPDVSDTAKKRTQKCANIDIYCYNILECDDLIKNGTAFYLFNPFNKDVFLRFVELIEKNCDHPVTLYYCNDLFKKVIDKREKWNIIRRGVVTRAYASPMKYTIYIFNPN